MKTHTNKFKKNISKMGKVLDSKITYILNGETIELSKEHLNSITPSFEGSLLKSIMKVLTIDSNVEIPKETNLNYLFGIKVDNNFEYLDFGNYKVYSIEKQEDTNSYLTTCYDKMLNFMVDYEQLNVIYPITIRNFIIAICDKFGIDFANENDTFVNYDKVIDHELFLTDTGGSLGYTFRDVLDQLAEVTASTICINENDELEIRYINDTESKNKFNLDKIYKGTWRNDYVKTSKIDTGLKLTCLQSGTQRWKPVYILDNSFLDKTITLSSKITDSNSQKGKMAFYWVNMNNLVYDGLVGTVEGTGTDKELTLTVTLPDELPEGQTNLAIFLYSGVTETNVDDYVLYKELMLEINSTKTDFEPAGDTIDEDYLKNVNVTFGEKFGPVNSIVLSRAGESDNIYLRDEESVTENGLCEIKIVENQIMNFNDRDEFLQEIFEQLNGLEYYINDFSSTGVCYYDICDKYYVKVANKFYKCIMFNDEINITQGLEENIYTEMPEESETDYKKADKTDRRINQAYSIVDKQNVKIEDLTSRITTLNTTTNNNYQELLTKFNDYTPQSDTIQIEQSVRQLQTDTYTKTEINTKLTDGSVTKVLTTAGTFDENGLTIEKTNAKSKGRFNEKGVTVLDTTGSTDTELLFAGFDEDLNESIVRTRNLSVTKYLNIGSNSRVEDYENGTGVFFVG